MAFLKEEKDPIHNPNSNEAQVHEKAQTEAQAHKPREKPQPRAPPAATHGSRASLPRVSQRTSQPPLPSGSVSHASRQAITIARSPHLSPMMSRRQSAINSQSKQRHVLKPDSSTRATRPTNEAHAPALRRRCSPRAWQLKKRSHQCQKKCNFPQFSAHDFTSLGPILHYK